MLLKQATKQNATCASLVLSGEVGVPRGEGGGEGWFASFINKAHVLKRLSRNRATRRRKRKERHEDP